MRRGRNRNADLAAEPAAAVATGSAAVVVAAAGPAAAGVVGAVAVAVAAVANRVGNS
jgi:hypothetical protein